MNSYMTAMNKRVDTAMKGVSEAFNLTHTLAQSFNRKIYALENVWPYTARMISQEAYSALSIHSCADQLLVGVQRLMEHKLPIELIPLHTLKQALNEVSSQLKKSYPSYFVSPVNIEYYYSTMPISYGRVHDSIYISVNIPITSNPSLFNIYQVLTFPVPVNQSTSHTTQIQNMSPYIAIHENQCAYFELREVQFSHCLGNKMRHCPFLLPQTHVNTHTCTSAVFFKLKEQIKALCDFSYMRHNIQSDIFEIAPGKLLITKINKIYTSCKDEITNSLGCKFCIITLPCHCSLKLDHRSIPSRITNCRNAGKLTVSYPVNLAVLHHFFDDELSHINPDTLFKTPVEYKIPSFNIYEHNLHKLIASDEKVKLNLKKMSDAAKRNEKIYQSVSEPILSGQWLPVNNWTSDLGIVTLSSIILSSFTLFVCLFIAYRFRMLLVVVATLQAIPQSKAFTNKPLIWNQPNPPLNANSPSTIDTPQLTLDYQTAYFYIFLLFICLFIVFLLMFKFFILSVKKYNKLVLKLICGNERIRLPVQNLPVTHHTAFFKNPCEIESFNLEKGLIFPSQLLINCQHYKLCFTNGDYLQIPHVIKIPWWKIRPVSRLVSNKVLKYEWEIETSLSKKVIQVSSDSALKTDTAHSTSSVSLYPTFDN